MKKEEKITIFREINRLYEKELDFVQMAKFAYALFYFTFIFPLYLWINFVLGLNGTATFFIVLAFLVFVSFSAWIRKIKKKITVLVKNQETGEYDEMSKLELDKMLKACYFRKDEKNEYNKNGLIEVKNE